MRSATRLLRGSSISDVFDPKWNSLNVLRLVFAAAVIFSHAWPLGGFGPDPEVGGFSIGGWAVGGFFVISGYLIAGSRRRTGMRAFLGRRFLRLMPGLWACLIVIVLIFVPVSALKEPGTFPLDLSAVVAFIVGNATLTTHDFGITGTLTTVPVPTSWNGSLWTLRFEVLCYLAIGILLTFTWVRRRPLTIAAIFVLVSALYALNSETTVMTGVASPLSNVSLGLELGTYFMAGALIEAYSDRIPMTWQLACVAGGILLVASAAGHARVIAPLPLAYLCIWLGARLPFQRIARVNDISYGVYIYAFPLQQLIVLFGGASHGVGLYIAIATVATVPFAMLSWFVVERPAMRLGKRGRAISLPPPVASRSS